MWKQWSYVKPYDTNNTRVYQQQIVASNKTLAILGSCTFSWLGLQLYWDSTDLSSNTYHFHICSWWGWSTVIWKKGETERWTEGCIAAAIGWKNPQLIILILTLWADRNLKRTHFLLESSVHCGTSFCLFSSFYQMAALVLTPGFLLGSHHRLLLPVAHIDTHRRPCPQGDPSCGCTIKDRGIGSHQNLLAPVLKGLLVMAWAAQWNPIKRNAAQAAGACLQGWGGGGAEGGGVMFPFPFLSSGECSACWHAVTAGTFKNYCGRTDTNQGWWWETDRPNYHWQQTTFTFSLFEQHYKRWKLKCCY